MNHPNAFVVRDASAAPFAEVPLALSGFPKEEGGEQCHYLKKEVIPVGDSRRHPDEGYGIHVKPEQVDGWISSFAQMSERGHEVPAPPEHRDRANSYGKWVALSREPNKRGGHSLYATLRVVGEKNKQDVLNKNVSICVKRNLKDDRGNVYPEAVEHIAVTPYPALTGLEGWTSIAASRGAPEEVPVFEMAAARTEEPTMDLAPFRKRLGLADSAPEAEVSAKLIERLDGIPAAVEAATKPLTEQVTALSRERDEARLELSRGSRADKPAPDPEILRDRADISLSRVDLAVAKGDVPAVVGGKLKEMIRKGDKPNAFMLSRSEELGERPDRFILKMFEGTGLGKKTMEWEPPGGVELSRRPNEADDKPVDDKRKRELLNLSPLGQDILAAK